VLEVWDGQHHGCSIPSAVGRADFGLTFELTGDGQRFPDVEHIVREL